MHHHDRAPTEAGNASSAPVTTTKNDKPTRSWMELAVALCHPMLLFDAYTFRWLTFDPLDDNNNKEQAFTKVTNVGLISALMLTVFASWVQSVATTSFARYGDYETTMLSLSSAALCTGVILLVMSVINSVVLLLAINDAEDDDHATILLRKFGFWFTLPAFYLYLGALLGSLGWFVWIPAVFPLISSIFCVGAGFVVGIALNAGFYQFIVLSVYEARKECGMNIPESPALIARFTTCGRKPPKIHHASVLVDQINDNVFEAERVLQESLAHVGHAKLLANAIKAEWHHLSALEAMEDRHAVEFGLPAGAAVRFLIAIKKQLKDIRKRG